MKDEKMEKEKVILGIDEAGRGPVLGPMVVAGVEIEKENEEMLKSIGVKDSKQLSRKKREELKEEIEKIAKNCFVEIIYPWKIDHLLKKINLNYVEMQAMARIINASVCDAVYLDLPSTSKKFLDELKNIVGRKGVKIIGEHKADEKFPVVSAASIVAKVVRDREMDKIRRKYADYGDIGSGYPADERTANFLTRYFDENGELPIEARKSWATSKTIMNVGEQKQLFSFSKEKSK